MAKVYRCGGYSSFYGHCGALDCVTCHGNSAYEYAKKEQEECYSSLEEQDEEYSLYEQRKKEKQNNTVADTVGCDYGQFEKKQL